MRLQNANADEHPSRIKLSAHVWTAPHLFGNRAGACQISGLNKEDVIIADCIYGYKYGKIEVDSSLVETGSSRQIRV